MSIIEIFMYWFLASIIATTVWVILNELGQLCQKFCRKPHNP